MATVAFDFDGTLLDSRNRHIVVMRDVLSQFGKDLNVDDLVEFKSNGKNNIDYLISKGIDKDTALKIQEQWVKNIEKPEYLDNDVLYNDAIELLEKYKQDNDLILVTARSNIDGLNNQIDKFNLRKYFKNIFIVNPGGDVINQKARILRDEDVKYFIGDTHSDNVASKIASTQFIFYKNGFHNRKTASEYKDYYDLIFSLGGSCAAACQLKRRNMRFAALPTDYTFFKYSGEPLRKLAEGFDNNFKNWLLKENLEELQGEERGADHEGRMQYIDTYTKYRWINHFNKPISEPGEYEEIKEKIDRRIQRLITFLEKSKRVLAIVSNASDIPMDDFDVLTKALKRRFPNLEVEYKYIKFEAPNNDIIRIGNVEILNCARPQNYYDFAATNFVWRFMDNCRFTNCLDEYRKTTT